MGGTHRCGAHGADAGPLHAALGGYATIVDVVVGQEANRSW